MRIFLGIDPGSSGGFVVLNERLAFVKAFAFSHTVPADIPHILKEYTIEKAFIEAVGAMPKQGVSSTFKFGVNYGWWQGVLHASYIRFDRVAPVKWQTYMQCRTGGDKNVSKARAQELFPEIKVTHAIADALLIAEYGRRTTIGVRNDDL